MGSVGRLASWIEWLGDGRRAMLVECGGVFFRSSQFGAGLSAVLARAIAAMVSVCDGRAFRLCDQLLVIREVATPWPARKCEEFLAFGVCFHEGGRPEHCDPESKVTEDFFGRVSFGLPTYPGQAFSMALLVGTRVS